MSYSNHNFHIIIRTKYSAPVLPNENSEDLYRFVWGFSKNRKCFLKRINGMPDHVHMLVSMPANLSVSDFVHDLKIATNRFLRGNGNFPDFVGWGSQYASFSVGGKDDEIRVFNYIKNQREHHRKVDFVAEFRLLIESEGIKIDEKYWLKDE